MNVSVVELMLLLIDENELSLLAASCIEIIAERGWTHDICFVSETGSLR